MEAKWKNWKPAWLTRKGNFRDQAERTSDQGNGFARQCLIVSSHVPQSKMQKLESQVNSSKVINPGI